MTHDERVYHHLYVESKSPLENAERIASLEELVEELQDENAKLVDVLHEVEGDAVFAYHCLQSDIEHVVKSETEFFDKWWRSECRNDNKLKRIEVLEAENAKLRELVQELWEGYQDPPCEGCQLKDKPACADCPICAREAAVIQRMRELGVKVDS